MTTETQCPVCGGSGIHTYNRVCLHCKGSGWITREQETMRTVIGDLTIQHDADDDVWMFDKFGSELSFSAELIPGVIGALEALRPAPMLTTTDRVVNVINEVKAMRPRLNVETGEFRPGDPSRGLMQVMDVDPEPIITDADGNVLTLEQIARRARIASADGQMLEPEPTSTQDRIAVLDAALPATLEPLTPHQPVASFTGGVTAAEDLQHAREESAAVAAQYRDTMPPQDHDPLLTTLESIAQQLLIAAANYRKANQ